MLAGHSIRLAGLVKDKATSLAKGKVIASDPGLSKGKSLFLLLLLWFLVVFSFTFLCFSLHLAHDRATPEVSGKTGQIGW